MIGARVKISSQWSFFNGYGGEVIEVHDDVVPWALVILDGDSLPLRFDLTSLVRV